MTMRGSSVLFALAIALLAAACSSAPTASFDLLVTSDDVVDDAVDSVQIILETQDLAESFVAQPPGVYFDGRVRTRVDTAPGGGVNRAYIIDIDRSYMDEFVTPTGMAEPVWTMNVPLFTAGEGQGMSQLLLSATFIRGTDRIATGQRFVNWPLVLGASEQVRVRCLTPFLAACANMSAPPPSDGGSTADAGP